MLARALTFRGDPAVDGEGPVLLATLRYDRRPLPGCDGVLVTDGRRA